LTEIAGFETNGMKLLALKMQDMKSAVKLFSMNSNLRVIFVHNSSTSQTDRQTNDLTYSEEYQISIYFTSLISRLWCGSINETL